MGLICHFYLSRLTLKIPTLNSFHCLKLPNTRNVSLRLGRCFIFPGNIGILSNPCLLVFRSVFGGHSMSSWIIVSTPVATNNS